MHARSNHVDNDSPAGSNRRKNNINRIGRTAGRKRCARLKCVIFFFACLLLNEVLCARARLITKIIVNCSRKCYENTVNKK